MNDSGIHFPGDRRKVNHVRAAPRIRNIVGSQSGGSGVKDLRSALRRVPIFKRCRVLVRQMMNIDAGERREVERRFGACDDRAIPTQCAGGECRECHRSAQDLTGRRYILTNVSDLEIAHALLNFFLLALHRINPVPVGGPEDFNHLVEGAI